MRHLENFEDVVGWIKQYCALLETRQQERADILFKNTRLDYDAILTEIENRNRCPWWSEATDNRWLTAFSDVTYVVCETSRLTEDERLAIILAIRDIVACVATVDDHDVPAKSQQPAGVN